MSDKQLAVGDRVTWLYMIPDGLALREGTVTQIEGDIATVREADGYHRPHRITTLSVMRTRADKDRL